MLCWKSASYSQNSPVELRMSPLLCLDVFSFHGRNPTTAVCGVSVEVKVWPQSFATCTLAARIPSGRQDGGAVGVAVLAVFWVRWQALPPCQETRSLTHHAGNRPISGPHRSCRAALIVLYDAHGCTSVCVFEKTLLFWKSAFTGRLGMKRLVPCLV